MIIVARHEEGIGLNPLEYLLDENGDVMLFKNKNEAIRFLKNKGASNDDLYFLKFLDAKTGEEL